MTAGVRSGERGRPEPRGPEPAPLSALLHICSAPGQPAPEKTPAALWHYVLASSARLTSHLCPLSLGFKVTLVVDFRDT